MNKLLDSYCVGVGGGGASTGKKKRVRPPKQAAIQVLTAAFRRFPRLCTLEGSGNSTHVVGQGKRLFHNELMRCCRVTWKDLSKIRAAFCDATAGATIQDEGAAPPPGVEEADRGSSGLQFPQVRRSGSVTPPEGLTTS